MHTCICRKTSVMPRLSPVVLTLLLALPVLLNSNSLVLSANAVEEIGPLTTLDVEATESFPTLKADYQFQNTLTSSAGTAPELTHLGDNWFAAETVDGKTRIVLRFLEGDGLALLPTSGHIPSDTYSIVVLFRFETITSWRRVVDFKNATSDSGLYNYNGKLDFYPVARGSNAPIEPYTYVQVVLTRDVAKNMVGYVNGEQQISFVDSRDYGVIDDDNILRFFRDDDVIRNEHSAGAVARIRLYDGPLSADQVVSLDRLPSDGILKVTSVSPNSGGNAGTVTVVVLGSGFEVGAGVRLLEGSQVVLTGENAVVVSSTIVETTFDLRGQTARALTLEVVNPDGTSAVAPHPFNVVNGGTSELVIDLIAPGRVRVGREAIFTAVVRNEGLINSELVSIGISADAPASRQPSELPVAGTLPSAASQQPQVIPVIPPGGSSVVSQGFKFDIGTCVLLRASATKPKTFEELEKCIKEGAEENKAKCCEEARRNRQVLEVGLQNAREKKEDAEDRILAYCPGQTKLQKAECERAKDDLDEAEYTIYKCEYWIKKYDELLKHCPKPEGASAAVTQSETVSTALSVCPVTSWDPNDKTGAAGVGEARYVRPSIALPYTVYFENLAAASGPAEEVLISDQLDPNLDWSSFSLDTIQIGEQAVTVPPGTPSFTTTVDLRPAVSAFVDVDFQFDPDRGQAQWLFRGRDPATGELTGFLPPNTPGVAPRGEGWVSYSITPKPNLPTGTVIRNKAAIDFEIGIPPAPMDTPEVANTIDSDAPTSQVLPLTTTQNSTSFVVGWSGTDNGSGVGGYTIYVSDNAGPYVPWQTNVISTTAPFEGLPGHTYRFFSRARDEVGNFEELTLVADIAVTTPHIVFLPMILRHP